MKQCAGMHITIWKSGYRKCQFYKKTSYMTFSEKILKEANKYLKIQLKKLDNFVKQRRENALLFQELFSKFSYLKIQKEIGKSSWFGFSFIIDEKRGLKRKDFLNFLNKEGFESRPIVAGNILRNPMIKYYEHSVFSNLKNSDNLHFNGLFLGNHHFSIAEQLNHLNKVIHNNFGS